MEIDRYSWVLAALPPDCGPILVVGDPKLAHTLAHSGFELMLADDEVSCDAVLTSGSAASACGSDGRLRRPEASLVAVDLRTDPRWSRAGRLGRGLLAALSPLLERRDRAARDETIARLSGLGLHCTTLTTGNRFPPSGLGAEPAAPFDLRDRPTGTIVIARAEAAAGSGPDERRPITAVTLSEAGCLLGRRLEARSMVAMASGKLLVRASAEGDGADVALRLACGPGKELIERSLRRLAQLRELVGDEAYAPLRRLVVWPLADGTVGPARYVVEPFVTGHQPVGVDDHLWDQCHHFLRLLHLAGQDGTTASDEAFTQRLERWCRRMAAHLDSNDTRLLSTLGDRVRQQLSPVVLGFGHGDLWPPNLMVDQGRLTAVLDWDWSSRFALPLVDALDLWAVAMDARASVEPGPRSVDLLWPLAHRGLDDRLHDLATAVGLRPEPPVIGAIVAAYWLERTYRDLRPFSPRPRDRRWFAANVIAPLRFFAREIKP